MAVLATSQSGDGPRATLADGEDLYVAAGVTVGSNNDSTIISAEGTSSNHTAIIAGNVVAQGIAIILGSDFADSNRSLTIRAGAEVIGFGFGGIVVAGFGSTFNNAGSVFSTGYGVSITAIGNVAQAWSTRAPSRAPLVASEPTTIPATTSR